MIPISFVSEGKSVMIKDIQMNERMGKKIKEMGVNRGTKIEIIKNDGSSLIIGISGSRLAISKGMAQKILAE
ncbi:ferrous iron transport protein A [Eubacterium multiforme]|uniref:Ferrous iron transport protein A n=1 Tax=Eubacterium multiforme TaxID=83339 RepID=A0ABT9UP13_9FIRM|nr:FeoA domain-containing protein [Eubacterium multiforme]MDQ0148385.1 ferrous iron transport protein A [Eubacterium multiforme]